MGARGAVPCVGVPCVGPSILTAPLRCAIELLSITIGSIGEENEEAP